MASTSPGYGITIRIEGAPSAQPVALATTVISDAGATITEGSGQGFRPVRSGTPTHGPA